MGRMALICAAIGAALAPIPAAAVERLYSNAVYLGASARRDRGLEPAAVRHVRCADGERGGRLDVAARARCRAARRLDAHCRQGR